MNKDAIKQLKTRAHQLKPVIMIGAKGLTDAVLAETEIALETHELIKIKIAGAEREDRKKIIATLSEQLEATLIQTIGKIATIYKKNDK